MKNIGTWTRCVSVVAVAAVAALSVPVAAWADSSGTDWTGAYAGANLGMGMASGNIDDPDCYNCIASAFSQSFIQGGVDGGYNKQLGSAVFGVEGQINRGSQNYQGNMAGDNGASSHLLTDSAIDWSAALLGRLGMGIQNTMVYVDAGPAIAHVNADANSANIRFAFNAWQPGFKGGVGAEVKLNDHLSVKAEYSVLTLASRAAYGTPQPSSPNFARMIWTNSQAAATVGVNWHF